jgi:hypothetical protein
MKRRDFVRACAVVQTLYDLASIAWTLDADTRAADLILPAGTTGRLVAPHG